VSYHKLGLLDLMLDRRTREMSYLYLSKGQKMINLSSGRLLSYAEYGDPAGIPVIGFHGTPGSRIALQIVSEAAKANNLRVIVVDRPGYGLSDPMRRPSFSLYARDIAELADALSLDRFIRWGASGGGPFALACAAELPKRVISVGMERLLLQALARRYSRPCSPTRKRQSEMEARGFVLM
jgi:pimeloyl-ACP methyl ester carboxylesterase